MMEALIALSPPRSLAGRAQRLGGDAASRSVGVRGGKAHHGTSAAVRGVAVVRSALKESVQIVQFIYVASVPQGQFH